MKLHLFNLKINKITSENLLQEIVEKAVKNQPSYLCAINSHMVIEAQKDKKLKEAILNADWAVTDGVPVSWAFSYYNKIKQERIAGMDITPQLINLAEEEGLKISVFGNSKENLDNFKSYVSNNHPSLRIGELISPPYRQLTCEELNKYIDQLNFSETNILFVSLGCPKQEKWMYDNSHKIKCVSLGIGNAINTTIGEEKRAPIVFQRIGLEWTFRLFQNPKRLFKRYLITNFKFCLLCLKYLIFTK